MKLGIVADVHCQDEHLLLTVQALIDEGVDEILLAGDAHYDNHFSNEVVDIIREFNIRYVTGNHEWNLMSEHGTAARTAMHVRAGNLELVAAAPESLRTTMNGKSLLMLHASPWTPKGHYLFAGDPLFQRCDELDADYLILGHTHVPMVQRFGRTLVINPGALAYSEALGALGEYAILDTNTDEVTQRKYTKQSFTP
ncbi:MAG: YfcE family phosphodiesterase [Actinomycetota bacterium]|nr:YfcE family phosphodiesterase [Actinomycetota bacterium]